VRDFPFVEEFLKFFLTGLLIKNDEDSVEFSHKSTEGDKFDLCRDDRAI
jgi:hypothetical protein